MPDYKQILAAVPSFLSLDISVRGTGWVIWYGGELTWGRYSIQAEGEVERVAEFDSWLLQLIAGRSFAYCFVEDVIQSCNFLTVRALIALNCQLEMLIYRGEVAQPIAFHKCNNRSWKKDLRLTANMDVPTAGSEKDKVKEYLTALGVDIDELRAGKYNKKQVEDICDALGMALGTIHEHIIT